MRAGDRVAVVCESQEQQTLALLAACWLGAIPCILSHPSTKQALPTFQRTFAAIVAQSQPNWLALSDSVMEKITPEALGEAQAILFEPADSHTAVTDTRGADLPAESPLFFQYSSGTTGLRKGVAVTGKMLGSQVDAHARALDLRSDDAIASWLPLYHDMGLVACLMFPLLRGIETTTLSPFEWLRRPESLLEMMSETGSTLVWLPNFAFEVIAKRVSMLPRAPSFRLEHVRAVINCSETVRPESIERFYGALARYGLRREAILASYAMAETTFAVTLSTPGKPAQTLTCDAAALSAGRVVEVTKGLPGSKELMSSGTALPECQVRIADRAETCALGEIEVKSPYLFSGYLNALDASESFANDGFFRTGDQGIIVRGELYVTGRLKDMIIVRGINVFPEDIEALVGSCAGCKPGRVVAFANDDHNTGTERVTVLFEPEGDGVNLDALIGSARERVFCELGVNLHQVVAVRPDTLLKSTSGKLARSQNRAAFEAGRFDPPPHAYAAVAGSAR